MVCCKYSLDPLISNKVLDYSQATLLARFRSRKSQQFVFMKYQSNQFLTFTYLIKLGQSKSLGLLTTMFYTCSYLYFECFPLFIGPLFTKKIACCWYRDSHYTTESVDKPFYVCNLDSYARQTAPFERTEPPRIIAGSENYVSSNIATLVHHGIMKLVRQVYVLFQGSFCMCAQPVRDDVTK